MANNKNRLDDLDFDNLDFDKINIPESRPTKQNDRSAITKVATSFGQGAREAFTNPAHIRNLASSALPKGYGTAINTGYEAYRGAEQLYNIAASELKPALPMMRRAAARVAPKVKSHLPKALARKLDEFAAGGKEAYRAQTQEQLDNAQITSDLASIFKVTEEARAEREAVQDVERRMLAKVRDKQAMVMASRLEDIRVNMSRLANYQDQVTARFQQKSLELQYRQYFATRDILRLHIQRDARDKDYFEALIKNTGLPDFAKINLREASHQSFRDKLLGQFQQGAVDYVGQFTQRLTQNLGTALKGALGSLTSAGEMAEMSAEQMEMMREMGMDVPGAAEMFGNASGNFAATEFGRWAAGPMRRFLSKHRGLRQTGARLSYNLSNVPERLNRWAKSETDETGVMAPLINFLKEMVPRGGLDARLGTSPIIGADQPVPFDSLTRRSIVEIIPGFLSRIHLEIAKMRTGNEGLSPITFNMDRGEFTTLKEAAGDARKRLFHPSSIASARQGLDNFIQSIDKDGRLSGSAREALKRQLMADTHAIEAFDPRRYTSMEELTPSLTGDHKEELSRLLGPLFTGPDGKPDYEALDEAARRYRELQNAIPNPKAGLSVYRDIGQRDLLNELGLITRQGFSDRVNYDKIYDLILGDDIGGATPFAPPGKDGPSGLGGAAAGVGGRLFDRAKGWATGSGKWNTMWNSARGGLGRMGNFLGEQMRGMADNLDRGGRATSFVSDAQARGASFYQQARDAASSSFSAASSFVRDVYVNGSKSPALQAVKLSAGQYFDQVTGEAVRTLDDIKGPVVDEVGDVVLSARDFAKGLHDTTGRQLNDVAERAKARAETLLGAHRRQEAAASGGVSGLGAGGEDAVMVGSEDLVRLNSEQVELLKGILEVLMTKEMGGGAPRGGILDRLFLGSVKKGWGALKLAGRGYVGYLKGLGKGVGAIFRGGASLAKNAGGMVLDRLRPHQYRIKDVYSKNSEDPLLLARKIRLGHYRDVNSNKTVTNLKSITGPVIDISTTENDMVLTQEDFDSGLYVKGANGFVRLALGTVGKAASTILGGYASLASLPFKAISWAANMAKTGLKMMFNDQVDVYITNDLSRPRLRATMMKSKRYYSYRTGKFIEGWKDIDGAVRELPPGATKRSVTDTEVLTDDEFGKIGICDAKGRPLKTGAQRVLGIVGKAASGVGRLAAGVVSGYGKLIGGMFGMGGDLLGGVMKRFGMWFNPKEFGAQSSKQTKLLEKIYKLLDERMPGDKPREGSWQDIFAERAAKKKEAEEAKKEEEKEKKSGFGSFFNMLKKAGGGLFGLGGDEEEEEGGDGDNIVIAGGGGGDGKKGGGRAGERDAKGRKRGGWRRNMAARGAKAKRGAGRFFGKLRGGKLGLLASLAGIFGLGALSDKLGDSTAGKAVDAGLTAWNVASLARMAAPMIGMGTASTAAAAGTAGTAAAAGTGALTAGGATAAAAGGIGAGGAAATAGTVAGGGLLATIGLPVAIIGAAAAAVGYAGYKVWKKYKYGTYIPLRAYRLTQYGIPYNNASQVEDIVDFEQLLEPHVTEIGGQLDISSAKLTMDEVYKHFGLDDGWFTNNEEERKAFDLWFNQRFKPVFLTWMTRLKSLKPGTRLNDVDDVLTQEEKKSLLSGVKSIRPETYSVMVGPFDGDKLELGATDVENAYLLAMDAIEKDKTKTGAFMSKLTRIGEAGSRLAPVPFADKALNWSESVREKRRLEEIKNDPNKMAAFLKQATGAAVVGTAAGVAAPVAMGSAGMVTNLEAIRFRAYGLAELSTDRVRALRMLESLVLDDLSFGSYNRAEYAGDRGTLMQKAASYFGINTQSRSDVDRWLVWLDNRFMPVILVYATTVRRLGPPVSSELQVEKYLKAEQLVELAQAINAATAPNGAPVWTFTISPWSVSENLNTDIKTTHASLLALKAGVKSTVAKEPEVAGKNAAVQKASTELTQMTDAAKAGQSWTDRAKAWLFGDKQQKGLWDRAKDGAQAVADNYRDAANRVSRGDYTGAAMTAAQGATAPFRYLTGVNVPKPPALTGNAKDREKALIAEAIKAGITDKTELAMLLGQASAESGGFKHVMEVLKYRPDRARAIFPKYFRSTEHAAQVLAQGPVAFADVVYGGRMGNRNPGDGYRYRGRGPFQLTGLDNYRAFAKWSGIDVVTNPDLVATDPKVGALSAIHYWTTRVKPKANTGDLNAVTKLINGGYNGLEHRRQYFNRYLADFANKSLQEIAGTAAPGASGKADFSDVTATVSTSPANSVMATPRTGGMTTTTANGNAGGIGGAAAAMAAPAVGPIEGLPGGKGYASMAAANSDSMRPASSSYASSPVPSIDRSAGLQLAAATGSEAHDAVIARQRQSAQAQAQAQDLVAQKAAADVNGKLGSMVDILGKSLTVQEQQNKLLVEVVDRLRETKDSMIAAVESVRSGDSRVADNSTPGPARGARPFEGRPAASPINVKRSALRG